MRSPLLFEKLNGRFPSGVEGISKMTALASYPEEECFSVYWKIKNFSYCCKEITSPEFSVSGGLYRLNLDSEPTQVVYEVFGSYYDHLGTSTIQISFLTCDGSPEESTSGGQCFLTSAQGCHLRKEAKCFSSGRHPNRSIPISHRFRDRKGFHLLPNWSETKTLFVDLKRFQQV
ncbi:hypothetical protein AVEN_60690-1 [Araneus ventricosus]|uniref:Uncharacterized protein n=1 Tax=Araneus ventricosus TaxID=182803 RepID=A0A4Y2P5I0_ARAVE|nr:hypothetical protein AVEN_60690-1 [Araneus ventricosus]